MDKEQALQDFLNSLKTALNNSAVYFPGHPIFIRSSEDLKQKCDCLLSFVNPLKIAFSPKSLFVESKTLDKAKLYEELAGFFHLRKIESLEMRAGLKNEELVSFLSKVSLPAKEILRCGGLGGILAQEKVSAISVKTLDYSGLLSAQGEELKGRDIWMYLFQADLSKQPGINLDKFTDNFGSVIENIRGDDLLGNEKLRGNIHNFLGYLKEKNPDKFVKCSKELVKLVVRDKKISPEAASSGLRGFFSDLGAIELSRVLWEEIVSDDNFDHLSFNLFSSLIDKKQNEEVAASFAQRISAEASLKLKPKLTRKIKELFVSSDKSPQQDAYRGRISGLLQAVVLEQGPSSMGEAGQVRESYRYLILNLLAEEKNKSRLALILERAAEEWEGVLEENDWDFVARLLEICRLRKEDITFKVSFEPVKIKMASSLEKACLERELAPELKSFLDGLEKSSLDKDYYLGRMFGAGSVHPQALSCFFRFFPQDSAVFIENLKKKSGDLEFLKVMIDGLSGVPGKASLEIFKAVFPFSHLLVKLEILKAMRKIPFKDDKFLLERLQDKDLAVRREAFLGLADLPQAYQEGFKILLGIKSGKDEVLKNINFIKEAGLLKEARPYLEELARIRFFWNNELKQTARKSLEELNAAGW